MWNRADILGRLAICLAITILFGALLFGASAAAQVQSAHPFAVPQQTLNYPFAGLVRSVDGANRDLAVAVL